MVPFLHRMSTKRFQYFICHGSSSLPLSNQSRCVPEKVNSSAFNRVCSTVNLHIARLVATPGILIVLVGIMIMIIAIILRTGIEN
jgi:hypothetical protein